MKYFSIFDKNVAKIFHLQWKIGNIPDMFLQHSVLCGICIRGKKLLQDHSSNIHTPTARYVHHELDRAARVFSHHVKYKIYWNAQ